MKNVVTLPNDVTSDGSPAESESTRLNRANVRSISNKKRPSPRVEMVISRDPFGANI